MTTTTHRLAAGAALSAMLVLGGAGAAAAGGGGEPYPPQVEPSETATITPQVRNQSATTATANRALAFTGSETLVAGGAAVALVAAGSVLVLRSRRQGSHS
jgi:hypothetical protein